MSAKPPKENLTLRLLRDATKICEEDKNGIVKPFHLLLAITRDPEAKIFLENLDFDFDKLVRGIEFAQIKLDTFPNMDDEQAAVISTDVTGIIQSAERISNHMDRPWAGYAEMLFALSNMGDDDTTYILDRVMNFDENYIDNLILDDLAEWTPHLKIVPKTSKEFEKAANDNPKSFKQSVLKLDDTLKGKVFDQEEAIDALHGAMILHAGEMDEEDATLGNYLFAGPTGVGKTEVAKQIAKELGMELVRIDMSEFSERHTVSNLIGAPPGYVGFEAGGVLSGGVDKANQKGKKTLLLLDEIEKAHPDVYDILLPIMDDGEGADRKGKVIDYKNTLIIMTSNAGARDAAHAAEKNSIGFGRQNEFNDKAKQDIQTAAINQIFSPEFRNRLDEIIQFGSLSEKTVRLIAGKFIDEMHDAKGAQKHNLSFGVSEVALHKLAEDGHDTAMGARPMKRLIKTEFRKKVARLILEENIHDLHLEIDYDAEAGKYEINRTPIDQVPLKLTYSPDEDSDGEPDVSEDAPEAPSIIEAHF